MGTEHRHRRDMFGLVMALIFAVVAVIGVAGSTWWVTVNTLPWAVTGAVALAGVILVLSSLPRKP